MNYRDRDKIKINCKHLASQINMEVLWPKLIDNQIFNTDDCNIPTWSLDMNSLKTKEDILLTIRTRGPYAFKNLLLSLRQSGHNSLANNLEGQDHYSNGNGELDKDELPRLNDLYLRSSVESSDEDSDIEEIEEDNDHYFNRILKTETPLKIVVKKSKKFRDKPASGKNDVENYVMRSKPRGLVLIVCNIEYITLNRRTGAQHDENNLKKLFSDMGFEVIVERDLTGAQIREVVKKFAARSELRHVDSCFVIFSSHGREAGSGADGEIAGIDYQVGNKGYERVYCSNIIEYFTSVNCKNLAGKPKVFIFQMCRGEKKQLAVSRHATDGVVIVQPNFEEEEGNFRSQLDRSISDIIVAHATLPGHYSYRDTINGTWCIQVLCEVFMKAAYKKHLTDLFHVVDSRLKTLRTETNECQTFTYTNMGFNKHMYLNPGLFKEAE